MKQIWNRFLRRKRKLRRWKMRWGAPDARLLLQNKIVVVIVVVIVDVALISKPRVNPSDSSRWRCMRQIWNLCGRPKKTLRRWKMCWGDQSARLLLQNTSLRSLYRR